MNWTNEGAVVQCTVELLQILSNTIYCKGEGTGYPRNGLVRSHCIHRRAAAYLCHTDGLLLHGLMYATSVMFSDAVEFI